MRVVLDTNVLISALLFGGTPERIFVAGLQRRIGLVTSEPLLAELSRVLECAAAAGADAIVTGDTRHLLPLGSFQEIPILDPASFATLLPGEPP